MKVLISTGVCGLQISKEMMQALFERDQSFFDPMPRSEWTEADGLPTGSNELQRLFGDRAVITESYIYFFKSQVAALRTNPWLIEQAEQDVARVVVAGYEKGVKVVELPDGVKWYLRCDDDGSESIHEEHRVWR